MWDLLTFLPIEVVSKDVFSFLNVKSIALFERAACGKSRRPHLLRMLSECLPLHLHHNRQKNMSFMHWFKSRKCKLKKIFLKLPFHSRDREVDFTVVESIVLEMESEVSLEDISIIDNIEIGNKVHTIIFFGFQNLETVERIGQIASNVRILHISKSPNCREWLTVDVIINWKLETIKIDGFIATTVLVLLISLCSKLKSFEFRGNLGTGTDCSASVMEALVQHCPQLNSMRWYHAPFTLEALLSLSDSTLPVEEVVIAPRIPDISTAYIPRCRHALSKVHSLNTYQLLGRQDSVTEFMSCFTELTSVTLSTNRDNDYIPVIAQCCRKLRYIYLVSGNASAENVAILCAANSALQSLCVSVDFSFTDAIINEIAQSCPHLSTLCLDQADNITDSAVLALSEHCPKLVALCILNSVLVTEASLLQLCQRCVRMEKIVVPQQSLSASACSEIRSRSITVHLL